MSINQKKSIAQIINLPVLFACLLVITSSLDVKAMHRAPLSKKITLTTPSSQISAASPQQSLDNTIEEFLTGHDIKPMQLSEKEKASFINIFTMEQEQGLYAESYKEHLLTNIKKKIKYFNLSDSFTMPDGTKATYEQPQNISSWKFFNVENTANNRFDAARAAFINELWIHRKAISQLTPAQKTKITEIIDGAMKPKQNPKNYKEYIQRDPEVIYQDVAHQINYELQGKDYRLEYSRQGRSNPYANMISFR